MRVLVIFFEVAQGGTSSFELVAGMRWLASNGIVANVTFQPNGLNYIKKKKNHKDNVPSKQKNNNCKHKL